MRLERKQEHIENYLKSTYHSDPLFDDIYVDHNALPNIDFDEIDLSLTFLDQKISYPIMINAITGGGDVSSDINEDLSRLAREFNIPMAVGSQKVAMENKEALESFEVVRDTLPKGKLVIGNISARENLETLLKADEIIDADAMQLHLNAGQELIMKEGDRSFKGILKNIEQLVNAYEKPIIVKEVGFGISKDSIKRLYNIGVRYVDLGGHGGTNFAEIEDSRRFDMDFSEFYSWGIPTTKCIIDANSIKKDMTIIAGGGIRQGLDIAKAFVLGADMVSISGELLSFLVHGEYEGAKEYIQQLIYKTKMTMALLGCKDVKALQKVKYKVLGRLKDLM